MQFRRPARKIDNDQRILPLINVVFLLLIFFMLAGRLTDSAPFRVTPPNSEEAEAPQASAEAPRQATLLLAADGRLSLDGVVMEPSALRAAMAERLAHDAGIAVRLKADGAAEAADVVAVMEILRDAGIARVQLFTQSTRDLSGAEARP